MTPVAIALLAIGFQSISGPTLPRDLAFLRKLTPKVQYLSLQTGSPEEEKLISMLRDAEAQEKVLLERYTSEHPSVRAIRLQERALQQQIMQHRHATKMTGTVLLQIDLQKSGRTVIETLSSHLLRGPDRNGYFHLKSGSSGQLLTTKTGCRLIVNPILKLVD